MSKCNDCSEKGFCFGAGVTVCHNDCELDIPDNAVRPMGLSEFNRAVDAIPVFEVAL